MLCIVFGIFNVEFLGGGDKQAVQISRGILAVVQRDQRRHCSLEIMAQFFSKILDALHYIG
jgi:hypothetical protein